ncbi:MAG TPA: neuraminidase (sialidase)-like protein [Verrucomicrobiales bacterium]|nr:neuraminidase (sialidase)-like protein [Verrucomicrobiales bacterium]HIL68987.1 neuraminidase (sialidase)-like protein [Verrucomicrobiota bacterium]
MNTQWNHLVEVVRLKIRGSATVASVVLSRTAANSTGNVLRTAHATALLAELHASCVFYRTLFKGSVLLCLAVFYFSVFSAGAEETDSVLNSRLIFPLESWHNHGSCIVECPNGDLLVCWFHGSGERRSDDVEILGARRVRTTGKWTRPFSMADTPGFPDTNCCMIIDPQARLWLFWPTIQANLWESALMKYKISADYMSPAGPPVWKTEKVLHMKPGDDFESVVQRKTEEYLESIGVSLAGEDPRNKRVRRWAENNYRQAGDKLTRRLGWFSRAHPYILEDRRLILGLYSDGFSFASATYTDDWGQTWHMSEPIVGGGNIQPSFARRIDGTLVAFMRDNGPAPQRNQVAESKDEGQTWTIARDHPDLLDPGAGNEILKLKSGRWILIHNNTEDGRHQLAISVSDDEGRSFRLGRYLEKTEPGKASFHYPSIIQARDGSLHATYSYFLPGGLGKGKEGKSIKYAVFDEDWILNRESR